MSVGPARGGVAFCGLELAHPVINASGTFDLLAASAAFGESLPREFPFAAFVSKTITLEPRAGNPPPRLWEAAAGLVNSIGLPNKGLAGYLSHDLPAIAELLARARPVGRADGSAETDAHPPVPLITNVMGSSAAEIARLLEACQERAEIAAVELNVSCPNVETGLDIGADPLQLEAVVREVRRCLAKPLIVKLTPNTADVAACAAAAEAGGADAVSLINTLRALALGRAQDAAGQSAAGQTRAARGAVGQSAAGQVAAGQDAAGQRPPWLGGGTGGLSGPAIRPVALAQVAAVARRVAIPVVGMGGVQSAAHARDLLDVGATLVAVGTESFRDPGAALGIARELRAG